MSASFALSHLSNNPLLPTVRSLLIGPHSTIEGIGILHDVPIWDDKTEIALDFHIFEVQDFDVLIGHPVEKLFQNISSLGTLDVTLGGRTFSSPILRSKDSLAEPMPQEEQVDEVQAIFPAETPESSLEKDTKLFIQEEDDQKETFKLPTLLQKSSQRSLNDEFRESVFAIPCLETPIAKHSVDHILLEEVKFVSRSFHLNLSLIFMKLNDLHHPRVSLNFVPLAQCFTLNLLKKRTFVPWTFLRL